MIKLGIVSLIAILLCSTEVRSETKATVDVIGVACVFCNSYLEGKFRHVPGVTSLQTNLKKSNFVLSIHPSKPFDYEATKKAVVDSGYTFGSISLTVTGAQIVKEGWIQDSGSKQNFELIESGSPISKEKWESIKTEVSKGTLEIQGQASPGDPIKIDIAMPLQQR